MPRELPSTMVCTTLIKGTAKRPQSGGASSCFATALLAGSPAVPAGSTPCSLLVSHQGGDVEMKQKKKKNRKSKEEEEERRREKKRKEKEREYYPFRH